MRDYDRLAGAPSATVSETRLVAGDLDIELAPARPDGLRLSGRDRALLDGQDGPAARLAMEIICLMAAAYGAARLTDVTRGHIDGCILAHDANLIFAEKLAGLGARTAVPTTINAISVDRENWRTQGVSDDFGARASRLADAYVKMGAWPSFTCAPYLLDGPPRLEENLGWSESNAVIYANSVLGARTPKHPDYLDLFIAMTGRAPETGVYTTEGRRARRVLAFEAPPDVDDAFWPLAGWLAGQFSPDHVPLLTGLEHLAAGSDDLKGLCAAFGTTSGAPMVHIAGHTPEADLAPVPGAEYRDVGPRDFQWAWEDLNRGPQEIDLVAIGSPHVSAGEARRIADLFAGRGCNPGTQMIVTVGRDVLAALRADATVETLREAGVRMIPDLCWCSMTEPVFPPGTRGLMTNSGKYAHYAHGLSGLHARFGGLFDCVETAVTGRAPDAPPAWLEG